MSQVQPLSSLEPDFGYNKQSAQQLHVVQIEKIDASLEVSSLGDKQYGHHEKVGCKYPKPPSPKKLDCGCPPKSCIHKPTCAKKIECKPKPVCPKLECGCPPTACIHKPVHPKMECAPKKVECPPKKLECTPKPVCPKLECGCPPTACIHKPAKLKCGCPPTSCVHKPAKLKCGCPPTACVHKPACPETCVDECGVVHVTSSKYAGWGWLGTLILWFIIFTVIFWLIYFSLKPSFVLQPDTNQVDTAKVLLAAVVSALILVIVIWLIKAAIGKK